MRDLDKTKKYKLRGLSEPQAYELFNWLKMNDINWITYEPKRLLDRSDSLVHDGEEWVFAGLISGDISILSLFEPDTTLVDSIKGLVEKISALRFKREDSIDLPVRPAHLGFTLDLKEGKDLCKVSKFEQINFDDTSWRLILEGNSKSFDGGLALTTTLDADRDKVLADVKETLETYLRELEKVAVKPTKESKLDEYLTKSGYKQGEERERMKKLIIEYNDFNPDLK